MIVKEFDYTLSQPAKLIEVEVFSKKEITSNIDVICKNLIALGFLEEKNKRVEKKVKQAIIKFQMDRGLPIGQYDIGSIKDLLNFKG